MLLIVVTYKDFMSDYRMDICGAIKLSDYSSIHDYIGVVGPNDILNVVIDSNNDEENKVLCSILESDKFNITYKGQDGKGRYIIEAVKKR